MDLSHRWDTPELMDTEAVTEAEFGAVLRDLAAVNRWTFTHRPMLAWFDRAIRDLPAGSTVSVLDVGFGEGDLLRLLDTRLRARHLVPVLTGIDLNPLSTAAARAAAAPGETIRFETSDVFAWVPDAAVDLIVSSQMTHHLPDAQVAALLVWMDRTARRGWAIVDIHRHWLPYRAFPLIARAFGWHEFVRHDGAVSVTRGFTADEWRALLARAGIAATVRWCFLFRHRVSQQRSAA